MKIEIEPKVFWKDRNWAFSQYSKLIKKYPDQWVAVVNKKVVASGEDPKKVKEKAVKKTKRKHIPLIFIEGSPSVLKN